MNFQISFLSQTHAPVIWEYKCNIVLGEFFPLLFFLWVLFLKHLCPCYCSCLMRHAHEIGGRKGPVWHLYHRLLIYIFSSVKSPQIWFGKKMWFWCYPVRWQSWFIGWLLLKLACSDPSLSLLEAGRKLSTFIVCPFFCPFNFSSTFSKLNLFSEGNVEYWVQEGKEMDLSAMRVVRTFRLFEH